MYAYIDDHVQEESNEIDDTILDLIADGFATYDLDTQKLSITDAGKLRIAEAQGRA